MSEIISALLCDFAQVREGVLFMASGGITRMFAPEVPTNLGVVLAVVIEIPAHELAEPHELRVSVIDEDANEVASVNGAMQLGELPLAPGEPLQVPFVIDLRPLAIVSHGRYDIRASVDDCPPDIRSLYVVDAPLGAPPAG